MKNKIFKLLLITPLLLLPFFTIMAVELPNPLAVGTFQQFITLLSKFIRTLAILVAPIVIIYAGIRFVTAAGNPEQIKTARNIILWTFIGLIIIFLADAIISFFTNLTKK